MIFGIPSGKLRLMGNTVGSKSFFKTAEDFYILGLWLADGYWRSSSIGLTSINALLIEKFEIFLKRKFPDLLIKKRVYEVKPGEKRKHRAFQVYINKRSIVPTFMSAKEGILKIPRQHFPAYLAGRIDGDGCIDHKHRSGIRIAYSNKQDAFRDQMLIGEINASLYYYKSAKTFVLYLKKHYRERILNDLKNFSIKLAP